MQNAELLFYLLDINKTNKRRINMFFKKKMPDDTLIMNFRNWFDTYRNFISDAVFSRDNNKIAEILDIAEMEIVKATPLFNKSREFNFGGKKGEMEFNLYHSGNSYLIKCAERMSCLMPQHIKIEWTMNISK